MLLEVEQADKAPRMLAETAFEILSAIDAIHIPSDQANLRVWRNRGKQGCGDGEDDDSDDEEDKDDWLTL